MNDLVLVEPGREMSVAGLVDQVKIIKDAMKSVMVEDVHYGTIPGCGDKQALFQPGAHKLGLLFNLAPEYDINAEDLPGEHREYEVVCRLTHRGTGRFIGQGVGVCSTRETKYRFRSEDTGMEVPQEYWESRDRDLIGGPAFSVRKVWTGSGPDRRQVWHVIQRVEHDNPADYYNTAKKIAKKRAYNDAILTVTAASDIFMPDDDTEPEFMGDDDPGREREVSKPARKSAGGNGNVATEKQRKLIYARLKSAEISTETFEQEFGKLDELPFSKVNDALDWVKTANAPA